MVEKGRRNVLKALLIDVRGQVMKVKEILCISRFKERKALADIMTINAQRSSVQGNLRTVRSNNLGVKHTWLRRSKMEFLQSIEG